jgi:hypothetical protein
MNTPSAVFTVITAIYIYIYPRHIYAVSNINALTPELKHLRAKLPDGIFYWGFCFLNRAFL